MTATFSNQDAAEIAYRIKSYEQVLLGLLELMCRMAC